MVVNYSVLNPITITDEGFPKIFSSLPGDFDGNTHGGTR